MSDYGPRVDAYAGFFQEASRYYGALRQEFPEGGFRNVPSQTTREVDRIAASAGSVQADSAFPYDSFLAAQAIRVGNVVTEPPSIRSRKAVLRDNIRGVNGIIKELSDGATHVAVVDERSAGVFSANGTQDLVVESLKPRGFVDDEGVYTETDPGQHGLFIRHEPGQEFGISGLGTDTVEFLFREEAIFHGEVMLAEARSSHLSIPRISPVRINKKLEDIAKGYIRLGNSERPVSSEVLSDLVATDGKRFCLRAVAQSMGLDWLQVDAPSTAYRDQVVEHVAQKVAALLMRGNVPAAVPGLPGLRHPRRRSASRGVPVREMSPTQLDITVRAAGSNLDELRERVSDAISAPPKTVAGMVSRVDAQTRLEPFFARLNDSVVANTSA